MNNKQEIREFSSGDRVPAVYFEKPGDRSVLSNPVQIVAKAEDDVQVVKIEIYNGAQLLKSCTGSAQNLTCEISLNLPNGNYMSYIRCPSVAEPYRIFSKIFHNVFSHQPPPSGISRAILTEKLWTKLEKPLLVSNRFSSLNAYVTPLINNYPDPIPRKLDPQALGMTLITKITGNFWKTSAQ
jgi:hypothetical protein